MDLKKTLTNAGRKLFPAAEKLYNLGTKIANSPEVQFIRDSSQFEKLTQTMADNEIGTAFQNMMDAYKVYESFPRNMSPEARNAVYNLNKAGEEYNQTLQKWANHSAWWPKNKDGEYYWQNYVYKQKYFPDDYAGNSEYTVRWAKAQPIFQWERFQPTDLKLEVQSWADLIREMNKLSNRYNELDALERTVWPKWNTLREQWKSDTKEAQKYLDQWFVYDDEKTKVLQALRRARDDYWALISGY